MDDLVITSVGNGFIIQPQCEPHCTIAKEVIKVCTDYEGLLELIKKYFGQESMETESNCFR